MQFEDSRLGKAAVVSVAGRVDALSAPIFEAHCQALIDKGDNQLVMDFADLDYLSSAGLRSLLSLAKKVQARGGKIVISGAKGVAAEIFTISGFASLFPMTATLEEAAREVL